MSPKIYTLLIKRLLFLVLTYDCVDLGFASAKTQQTEHAQGEQEERGECDACWDADKAEERHRDQQAERGADALQHHQQAIGLANAVRREIGLQHGQDHDIAHWTADGRQGTSEESHRNRRREGQQQEAQAEYPFSQEDREEAALDIQAANEQIAQHIAYAVRAHDQSVHTYALAQPASNQQRHSDHKGYAPDKIAHCNGEQGPEQRPVRAHQANAAGCLLKNRPDPSPPLSIPGVDRLPGKATAQREDSQGGDGEAHCIEGEEMGQGQESDQQSGHARSQRTGQATSNVHQTIRRLQRACVASGQDRQAGLEGWIEERAQAANHHLNRNKMPELQPAGQRQHRQQQNGGSTHQVNRNHDAPPVPAISIDTAEQTKGKGCGSPRSRYKARATARGFDGNPEHRDCVEIVADSREHLAGPEQRDLRQAQRA